jgi:uncharacterized membrane protein YgcG
MITNPYLKTKQNNVSWKSELKRLMAGPQALLTLVLVVLPLALSILGALDFGSKFMYDLSSHGAKDTRKAVWVGDCMLNNSASVKLCKDKSNQVKTYYWPPFLPSNEAYYYGLPLLVALLSFVSIGNPRFLRIGTEFKKVLGLIPSEETTSKENGPNVDPVKNPKVWLVGAASERKWQSDPGYFYQDKSRLKPYCLNWDMLRTNLLIVAPPGSGKTSSIFRPLIEYLRRIGASAIFFDSKGQDFPAELFDLNFELSDPSRSIKINLFSGDSPSQAGERLGEALIPNLSDDKQYYVDVAKDTCAALVSSHHACFGSYPDLTQLLLYLSEPAKIVELSEWVRQLEGPSQLELERLAAGLNRINSLLTNTKKDTLGSLNTALTPLTTSAAGALLVANPEPGGKVYTIEELLKEPRLVRLSLPVAENPRIAPIIGRIILTQFNFVVLSPNCNRNILKIAAVDEAHNFITASIAKGMAQARSNNAGFMLALQTLSQIPDESVLDTIFASAGNKLVMAGVGDQDAERFSKTYGELEMPYITHSKSRGQSSSTNSSSGNTTSYSAGRSTTGGSSNSGGGSTSSISRTTSSTNNTSSSTQLRLRRLFFPAEVRALPQYHAIIESSDAYGRRWSATMIDMSQLTLKELLAKNQAKAKKAKTQGEAKVAVTPAQNGTSSLDPREEALAEIASPAFGKLKVSVITGNSVSPWPAPASATTLPTSPATSLSQPVAVTNLPVATSLAATNQPPAVTAVPQLKQQNPDQPAQVVLPATNPLTANAEDDFFGDGREGQEETDDES